MIQIDALTVQFGGVKPLDALDARFEAPICGLIGPNGAGKTTLLNVLSGFITPIEGVILLNDAPAPKAFAAPPRRHRLAPHFSAGTCSRRFDGD